MRVKTLLLLSLLVVGAFAAAIYFLRRDNAQLAARAAVLRQRNAAVTRLVAENQRTRELLTREATNVDEAAQDIHQDVLKLRDEVHALESRAHAVAAQKAVAVAALATNRNPEAAPMSLENFQNVGRSTPLTAMQTLIWAAVTGDERALEAAFSVTGDAREKAEEMLARLPETARAQYPTPESLAALAMASEILRADALQVVPTVQLGLRAIVTVRVADSDDDAKVPMELDADGWKVTVPKKFLNGLDRRLNPPAPSPAPKK